MPLRVLFGGLGVSNAVYNDTWEYDGTAWTQRTPSPSNIVPAARWAGAMAFDSSRAVTTLVGGNTWVYGYDTKNELTSAKKWTSDPDIYGTGNPLLELFG